MSENTSTDRKSTTEGSSTKESVTQDPKKRSNRIKKIQKKYFG